MFNAELFWRSRDGAISIIEINPRVAAQFADPLFDLGDDARRVRLGR